MECKVSELVKRGHDQAAELKASCGAVDVRDVAQLISDLATQLDVQLARSNALAAENAGLKSAIEKHADSYIMCGYCRTERDGKNDDVCEVLDSIPATDAFLAEMRSKARNEGINYAAGRLAAAFNHGFVDKPLAEVCDVVHMILDTKEELAGSMIPTVDGLSGEYAEAFLKDSAAQLRKGVQS
ncbi:hypothetical protein ACJLW5_001919 [Enterobacter hormaechei]|uniref:hypothetical protein n=1 Tax=Enterobacter cloacae complex TaxID=354276 RepID=UPI0013D6704D|nr:hypothetical protein [Enterobacter hormaechei]HCM9433967.1 hypothetical protein [Enterobacter hormaechei subsp. steigerwaltii]EHF4967250.1 hypothetical protein [Enterobacter hormaechei]EMA2157227.1 hypothetical protein [Enterobacter hormaechei]MCM7623101.1 hypothetical protein [Enterobacter hormaechei]MCM7848577.1 hypothetical protein [Enterobacter hormaechei]